MLQILPLQIPAAGKPLGKGEVGKVSGPKTREASGRITFLTAGLADAISRRDPEVGGASVEHDGEPLWRCPDAHNPVVLRLREEQPAQPRAASSQLFLRKRSAGEHHTALPQGLLCNSI